MEKKKAKPGPRKLAKEFGEGNWTNMLAERHDMPLHEVERKLMQFCRQAFQVEKRRNFFK